MCSKTFYHGQIKADKNDKRLYELVALSNAFLVGKADEKDG